MQYYRTVERSISVRSGSRLRIANRSGELTVVGEDRDDIAVVIQMSVDADSQREGDARLDAIDLPIASGANAVEVGPPEYDERPKHASVLGMVIGRIGLALGGTRVNIAVRVPRDCVVTAEQRSGPLRVSGLRAGLTAESRAGHCEVHDIEGRVSVRSRSGATELRDIRGELEIEGRSGRIEVEGIQGDTTIQNRSGKITVRDARGTLTLTGRAGRVELSDISGPIEIRSHSGAVELRGRIAWPVDIELHSGNVKLAVTRESGFFMDAETSHGSIRSDLPVDYLSRPPADAPVVKVRMHAGALRVVAA